MQLNRIHSSYIQLDTSQNSVETVTKHKRHSQSSKFENDNSTQRTPGLKVVKDKNKCELDIVEIKFLNVVILVI